MYGCIVFAMAKPSNRDKILNEGLKVVHHLGFGGASVRDIIQAAGVPQGSFTNHFQSKEAFGLEILEIYFTATRAVLDATLCNDALPPLVGLRDYIAANMGRMEREGIENGCLFGNFIGEAIDHSEPIRDRLVGIFADVRKALAHNLRAAVQSGDVPDTIDVDAVAEFIVGGLQGAILLAKVQHNGQPLARFEQILFGMVLGRADMLQPAGAAPQA
jgi:TetR/AcrR family transcriptional regulator, transcriptional repressor for nem operon